MRARFTEAAGWNLASGACAGEVQDRIAASSLTSLPSQWMVRRVVSGGQTGADRAALDAAMALGLECGGWVPSGRVAEDGVIPLAYPDLVESTSAEPDVRTGLNVKDSDATVVLTHGAPRGGTALTLEVAARIGRPALLLDLTACDLEQASARLAAWLSEIDPGVLNVAGPRASEDPRIYEATRTVLANALRSASSAR